MKFNIFLGASASAFLLSSAASAAVLDSFDVLANDATGIDSSVNFVLGTEYLIEVSGTFIINNSIGRLADAEWVNLDPGPFAAIPNVGNTAGNGADIGLSIAGMDIDWGAFNANHEYSYTTSALSGIVNFAIVDSSLGAFSDNSGSLSVTVSADMSGGMTPVPLPAALPLMLVGLGSLAWMRRRTT